MAGRRRALLKGGVNHSFTTHKAIWNNQVPTASLGLLLGGWARQSSGFFLGLKPVVMLTLWAVSFWVWVLLRYILHLEGRTAVLLDSGDWRRLATSCTFPADGVQIWPPSSLASQQVPENNTPNAAAAAVGRT